MANETRPLSSLVQELCRLAETAGQEAMRFYHGRATVTLKADSSPLTEADRASHEYLARFLPNLLPGVPVISEESSSPSDGVPDAGGRFWLVDPLDGTKEFLKATGEFTVNVALIDAGRPIVGVVHAPALNSTYYADIENGAYHQIQQQPPVRLKATPANPKRLRVVASKDHAGPVVAAMLARMPEAELKSMGSSLKFCLVAAGEADLYLRDIPTMEWDTAAAQCVVEASGGKVCTLDGLPLRYGKPGLKNPSILTVGDSSIAWQDLIVGNGSAVGIDAAAPTPIPSRSAEQKSDNIYWTQGKVSSRERELRNGHPGSVVWLTGLSASGKSTIATELERQLFARGNQVAMLDGDNIRHALCSDLGFSQIDRTENIRRIGEVAKLVASNGLICITAFISPYRADRDLVRKIMPEGRFAEVYVNAPLDVCEARDPKGLYAKARSNAVKNFTGISAPYESPDRPELELRTDVLDLAECVKLIVDFLERRAQIWRETTGIP